MSSRALCTGYQSLWRTLNTSAHCIFVSESQGKHNTVDHWREQCFIYIEKRPSKISCSRSLWSPMASRSLLATNAVQFAYIHPSHTAVKGPC